MSTKAIRALIERAKREGRSIAESAVGWPDAGLMADKALLEVDAIERAAGAWVASDMGELPEEHATTMESIARSAP